MALIENVTYDELAVGDSVSSSHLVTEATIALFAAVSGDNNPAHMDQPFAEASPFKTRIAHGMWSGALISALLGTRLPGPGTIYLKQDLSFRAPVTIGDTLTVSVTVAEKAARNRVSFTCTGTLADGTVAVTGTALVLAPSEKISRPAIPVPTAVITAA